eukprot:2781944-Alexandrium_andersonii.AAC.1
MIKDQVETVLTAGHVLGVSPAKVRAARAPSSDCVAAEVLEGGDPLIATCGRLWNAFARGAMERG